MKQYTKILILENIRSAQNVGSIFRSSDAVGIDKIYIAGITPDPVDRFGRYRKDISKASLGAEKSIPWEHVASSSDIVKKLKEDGFKVASLEQDERSIDYKSFDAPEKIAIVLGSEVDGVSKEVLNISDVILEIPMKGEKESLNVSVAGGVLLFRLFDK
ncbi:TrmH family RNA methyltransferase [Candidatus Nomurabacteria bacterium]|nr:TrmH family RNA methyltransferase [Candidatus Nomurabacteria bacterium]USN94647.1 MAG: TrmH family RNA methyltransferase [Candidatus Nomurabacteria bacterium]